MNNRTTFKELKEKVSSIQGVNTYLFFFNGKPISNEKDNIIVKDLGVKNKDTLLCMVRSIGGQK